LQANKNKKTTSVLTVGDVGGREGGKKGNRERILLLSKSHSFRELTILHT
jgi:hypothetical protein